MLFLNWIKPYIQIPSLMTTRYFKNQVAPDRKTFLRNRSNDKLKWYWLMILTNGFTFRVEQYLRQCYRLSFSIVLRSRRTVQTHYRGRIKIIWRSMQSNVTTHACIVCVIICSLPSRWCIFGGEYAMISHHRQSQNGMFLRLSTFKIFWNNFHMPKWLHFYRWHNSPSGKL